jgi:2-methylcitrate dehydratase PrpD
MASSEPGGTDPLSSLLCRRGPCQGTIEYEFFNDDFVETEKAVVDMLPMIKVVEDGEMTQAFPKGAPCRVVVTLKDGSVLECCRGYPRGDCSDPLRTGRSRKRYSNTSRTSRAEIRQKP